MKAGERTKKQGQGWQGKDAIRPPGRPGGHRTRRRRDRGLPPGFRTVYNTPFRLPRSLLRQKGLSLFPSLLMRVRVAQSQIRGEEQPAQWEGSPNGHRVPLN